MSTPPPNGAQTRSHVLVPKDIADFLGQGDDDTVLALAGQALPIIRAMAYAYTRGGDSSTAIPSTRTTRSRRSSSPRLRG